MCHKLLQVYHCRHTKEICTTPCPHALTNAASSLRLSQDSLPNPGTPTSSSTLPPASLSSPLPTISHAPAMPEECVESTPNLCTYFFARYLAPSNHPCLNCYMQPEYARYRQRWINEYRIGHPGSKLEDLASLAGVEQVPGRVGLVNVIEGLGNGLEEQKH